MSTETQNKIEYGLDKVHYAKITGYTDGVPTYATPILIDSSVSITLTPKGETQDIYASNGIYYTLESSQGYEGTLEAVYLPDNFRTDIMGETLQDGVQIEYSTQKSSEFALLFEFIGDAKERRHALYVCKASRPKIESSTTTDKTDVKNISLDFVAKPRTLDKVVKASTTAEVTPTIYDSWFTTVYDPTVIAG